MTDSPSQPENTISPLPHKDGTRARGSNKIPPYLSNPDGSVIHLSRKQRGILRRLPKADKFTDIADEMKCSPSLVTLTFKIPAVQEYLKNQLDAAGATHGKIFARISEALDAKTGKDKFNQERPDHKTRLDAAKLSLHLQGMSTPTEDKESTINNVSLYQIVINARQARGLEPRDATPGISHEEKDKV